MTAEKEPQTSSGSANQEKRYEVLEDLPGVGPATSKKLKEMGFHTIESLATATARELEPAGIGEKKALDIIRLSRTGIKLPFVRADELLKQRQDITRLSTSSMVLDDLFGGGLETQTITEFYGAYGSGKSQIGFQLVVNVQLPKSKGGLGGDAVFIDTEGTFRPERIEQIAKALGLDPKNVLKKIYVARAFSSDHQMLLAEKIPEFIEQDRKNIKLVVVDSLMGLFRSEFIGRGTLANRQQKLNKHLHALQRLADRFKLAIYVTNQVMSRPDVFFGDQTAAVGGHVLAHAATYRVYLRKSKGNKRIARLVDSPSLPEAEAVFTVDAPGIRD